MALLDDILTPDVPDGKNLFHYTTQDGLLGIVRDKELWVSSILHMNDAAEFNYTVELVRETIRNKRKSEKPPRTDLYDEILKQLRRFEDMTIFVGSFSERRDSLSQWRAYTHNGIGFSVGFEYEYLALCAQRQGYIIRRCNYDKDKHRRLIEELLAISQRENLEENVRFFVGAILKVAPILKHHSFEDEREWRLVSGTSLRYDENVLFRPGKSMLIPYQKFSLLNGQNRMGMSQVCVGPTPHPDLAYFSVSRRLEQAGLSQVCEVHSSEVPYRAW